METLNLSGFTKPVVILSTMWNLDVVSALVDGCRTELLRLGMPERLIVNIQVRPLAHRALLCVRVCTCVPSSGSGRAARGLRDASRIQSPSSLAPFPRRLEVSQLLHCATRGLLGAPLCAAFFFRSLSLCVLAGSRRL
tara:strand:+ start:70 stop:483 length:414 start_codon:yes stop_codon:yes gene_type:complete